MRRFHTARWIPAVGIVGSIGLAVTMVLLTLITGRVALGQVVAISFCVPGLWYSLRELFVPLYEIEGRALRMRKRRFGDLVDLEVPEPLRVEVTPTFVKLTAKEVWLHGAPPGTALDNGCTLLLSCDRLSAGDRRAFVQALRSLSVGQ